jgi:hypothetical protein
MKLSSAQVQPIERLTELALKVILFGFILLGTAVLTGFYIYCVVNDKGTEAKAISGFGDAVFFAAFGKLVWNYFVRDPYVQPGTAHAIAAGGTELKKHDDED